MTKPQATWPTLVEGLILFNLCTNAAARTATTRGRTTRITIPRAVRNSPLPQSRVLPPGQPASRTSLTSSVGRSRTGSVARHASHGRPSPPPDAWPRSRSGHIKAAALDTRCSAVTPATGCPMCSTGRPHNSAAVRRANAARHAGAIPIRCIHVAEQERVRFERWRCGVMTNPQNYSFSVWGRMGSVRQALGRRGNVHRCTSCITAICR